MAKKKDKRSTDLTEQELQEGREIALRRLAALSEQDEERARQRSETTSDEPAESDQPTE
jgi:hypothetical protein